MTESKSPEHVAWEIRLGRLADLARAWQRRLAEEPPKAERGSPLAGDDAGFIELSVSNLASYSMATSTEHLDFCLSTMAKTQTMFPSAYLTVLRTALLTASHAAWILAPKSRQGRQMNALRLTADDVRSQVAMVRTAYVSDASAGKAKDAELLRLTRHQARLQEIADALGLKSDVTKPLVNNTAIIEEVARTVHDEELSIGGVNLIWRTGSAAAHGGRSFAIARLNRGEIRTGASGDKFARLRGDLHTDVGPAAAAATMALSGAFNLFDERGRRP